MAEPSWIVVEVGVVGVDVMLEAMKGKPTRLWDELFRGTERRTDGTAL